jgi:prepilin-type N-terminal cleavage/methylation domain-containing protein
MIGSGQRGFTLIEMMVVVGMLAVFAALATPNVTPLVAAAKLEGNTTAIASLIGRAQAEAMAQKRCTRVRIDSSRTIIAEALNVFDCDTSPSTAPLIDSSKPLWVELTRLQLDSAFTAAFDPAPSELSTELRFRPSGRLWSADTDVTDDDGVIRLTSSAVQTGMANTKKVLVEAQGLICLLPRGKNPTGSGNNLGCP